MQIMVYFRNSIFWKFLELVFEFFSRQWERSGIMYTFSTLGGGNVMQNSFVYRLFCFLPNKVKSAAPLGDHISQSAIIDICARVTNNFVALSTRFWGVFMGFGVVFYCIFHIPRGMPSALVVIPLLISPLMTIKNHSIVYWCSSSLVMQFLIKGAGFDMDLSSFKQRAQTSGATLAVAALFGSAAGALANVSPMFAALPFAFIFVCLVLLYVEIGVFAAAFLAPFAPTMTLVGLTLLCGFSLIIRCICKPSHSIRVDGIGFCILLILSILAICVITSMAFVNSAQVWLIYIAFMGFYFVVFNTIKSREGLDSIIKICVISGVLVAIYGILQYLLGWNTNNAWIDEQMFADDIMRVYSTLENPNVLGEYLLLILPLCASVIITVRGFFPKTMYSLALGVLAVCLILTQSRGCYLGVALSGALFVTFICGKLWWLVVMAIPFIPMFLPQTVVQRISSIGDMADSSTSYRVFIWLGTLALLRDFWYIGIGMGEQAYNAVYPFYSYHSIIAPHSHNLFLQFLTQAGILGLTALVIFIVAYFVKLSKSSRSSSKGRARHTVAVAIGTALAGFLLQSMFDYTFYNYRVMLFFWIFIAIGAINGEVVDS